MKKRKEERGRKTEKKKNEKKRRNKGKLPEGRENRELTDRHTKRTSWSAFQPGPSSEIIRWRCVRPIRVLRGYVNQVPEVNFSIAQKDNTLLSENQ